VNVKTDQNGEPHSNPSLVMACYIQSKEQRQALQMTTVNGEIEFAIHPRNSEVEVSTVFCVPYWAHIRTIALPNSCFPYVVINVQLSPTLPPSVTHVSSYH